MQAVSRFAALVSLVLFVFTTTPVLADGDADEAELSFQLGANAYRQGDFQKALQYFLASNRLVRNRNVMFNIARSYEQLGRFPEAYRYYVSSLDGETDAAVRKGSEEALVRIAPKVAVIAVETSPPGATIYLDRKDLGSVGVTPSRLGLPAGKYRVLVELPGYESAASEPIEVTLGSTSLVRLPLQRVTGRIQIGGEAGATVHLDDDDGAPDCVTPCTLETTPGIHVLFLARPGAPVTPRRVEVQARKTVTVEARLAAATGSLLVSAEEPNALIEIDGQPVGFTPTVVRSVVVGRRKVRVSLRGYQAVEREVDIVVGEQANLRDLPLVPLREVAAASRTSESVDDAPASVTVIAAQELEAFGYPTVLEALRGVRGFAVSYDSTYGNASVRGLGRANDFANRMLLLGDGAVLNEDVLYQPFLHYDGRVDLADLERIEIVRGPGSVLYGTGAVAAVVNLVTRGPDEPDQVEVGLSTSDAAVARGRGSFRLRLGQGSGVWASLSGAHGSGRDEDLDVDGAHVPVHDVDRFDAYTFAGRAWKGPLTLQWFWTDRELVVPTGAYGSILDDDRNTYADTRGLVELRFEPRLGASTQLFSRLFVNLSSFASDFVYADGADEEIIHEEYEGRWAGGELRLVFTPSPRLRLSLGGEVDRHFDVTMTSVSNGTDELLDVSAPYGVYAGYASVDWRVVPSLKLVAGVRADYWDLSQTQLGFTMRPLTDDFTSFSPRLALIWKPRAADVVKLMVGRAFRAPSTYEYFYTDGLFTQATSDCCSDTPLAPETVWTGELEATHAFPGELRLTGSVFVVHAADTIETVPVPEDVRQANGWDEGISYYTNSAVDQLVLGSDVEIRREWRGGSFLAASYSFQSARYTDSPMLTSSTFGDARRVPNQPSHMASLRAVAPLVGNRLVGALRLAVEGPRRIQLETDEESDGAVIADLVLSGRVALVGLKWHAGLYNLFDWQTALPATPYASPLMPQTGRSLLLGVSYSR